LDICPAFTASPDEHQAAAFSFHALATRNAIAAWPLAWIGRKASIGCRESVCCKQPAGPPDNSPDLSCYCAGDCNIRGNACTSPKYLTGS